MDYFNFEAGHVATASGKIYFCHPENGICILEELSFTEPYLARAKLVPLQQNSVNVSNFRRLDFNEFTMLGFSVVFDVVECLEDDSDETQPNHVFERNNIREEESESPSTSRLIYAVEPMDEVPPVLSPAQPQVSRPLCSKKRRRLEPTNPCRCSQCGKGFKNPKRLLRHMPVHSNDRPNQCQMCGRSFKWKQDLDKHMRQNHRGLDTALLPHDHTKPYVCHTCGYKGEFERALRIHQVLAKHIPPGGIAVVPRKRSRKRKDPVTARSRIPTNPQMCRDCGLLFRSQELYKRHVAEHRPYPCNICDQRFAAAENRLSHTRMHLDLDQTIHNVIQSARQ